MVLMAISKADALPRDSMQRRCSAINWSQQRPISTPAAIAKNVMRNAVSERRLIAGLDIPFDVRPRPGHEIDDRNERLQSVP